MLGLEHRYYGASRPTVGFDTPEEVQLLSSEQALADVNNFLIFIKENVRRQILKSGAPRALKCVSDEISSAANTNHHTYVSTACPLTRPSSSLDILTGAAWLPGSKGDTLTRLSVRGTVKGYKTGRLNANPGM